MDQGKTGAVIISYTYDFPALPAGPQDRKTARPHDRKTARPQDRKTLDLYPHLLHQQRGVEAGADARGEAVVEEEFLVVYLHIKMIVLN